MELDVDVDGETKKAYEKIKQHGVQSRVILRMLDLTELNYISNIEYNYKLTLKGRRSLSIV